MIDSQLLDYIKEETSLGKPVEEIKNSLLQAGWVETDIDQAFSSLTSQVETHQPIPIQTPPAQNVSTPDIVTADADDVSHQNNQTQKRKRPVLFILGIFIIFILVFLSSVSLLLAYDKITLPNSKLNKQIKNFVMSLPFTPKTPEFIIESAVNAHKNVKKVRSDLTFSAASNSLSSALKPYNMEKLELKLIGQTDYENIQNPLASLSLSISDKLEADFRLKDKILYFKVNKLPQELLSSIGAEQSPLLSYLNKWIYFDTASLENEAKNKVDELNKKTVSETQSKLDMIYKIIMDEILPEVKILDDKIDNFDAYKLHVTITKEMLDRIVEKIAKVLYPDGKDYNPEEKPSKYVENFTIDGWIDKKEYYVRQLVINLKTKTPKNQYTSMVDNPQLKEIENDILDFTAKLKYSDFNTTFTVEIPPDPIKLEDVISKFMGTPSPSTFVDSANLSAVKFSMESLREAVERYLIIKGALPKTTNELLQIGEINEAFATQLSTNQIFMKQIQNGEKVFIYTMTQDPENKNSPYYSITVSNDGNYTEMNYTKSEIEIIIK